MNQLQQRDYFYLVSSLPEMVLDQSRAPFTVVGLVEQLEESLEPQDMEQVRLLLRTHDNDNLLRLLKEEAEQWDELGEFSKEEMQERMKDEQGLPSYMHKFVQAYQNEQPIDPDQSWENQLTALYYDYALQHSQGFLYDWLVFDRDLRNFLAAWNKRRYELRAEGQLIGQSENLEALQKSRARDFGLGTEYPYLSKLLNDLERDDLQARAKAIDRIKWNYIAEQLTFHYFTIEVVLGYLLQLDMLQRWLSLDQQAGQERVRNFISEMEQKIELT
jgi:hypothetical protein